jgi:hypothetical protein
VDPVGLAAQCAHALHPSPGLTPAVALRTLLPAGGEREVERDGRSGAIGVGGDDVGEVAGAPSEFFQANVLLDSMPCLMVKS